MSKPNTHLQFEVLPKGQPVSVLTPSPTLRRAALVGSTLSLLPLNAERDAPQLYAASHGDKLKEQIYAYLPYGPFEDLAMMKQWYRKNESSRDPVFFSVTDRQSKQAVGQVTFMSIDLPARRLELGHIWYAPDRQRGRTNTETIYLMLCEAFGPMNCRRVEWKCDAHNQRSRKAAERLGFQHEGIFRQHLIVKGRNRDSAWFSILDSEWPSIKQALEQWLNWSEGSPPPLASLR